MKKAVLNSDPDVPEALGHLLIKVLKEDYRDLEHVLFESPHSTHADLLAKISRAEYDARWCEDESHLTRLRELSIVMLGLDLVERTRHSIGEVLGRAPDNYINDDEFINFVQQDQLQAVALLLFAWFGEIPEQSPAQEYRMGLAEFANQQEDPALALKVMRTNLLLDHRSHYLQIYTKDIWGGLLLQKKHDESQQSASVPPDRSAALLSLQRESQEDMFVKNCKKYRTYMEKLVPKKSHAGHTYESTTEAWTAYWRSKVNEATREKVGPIWELLQSQREKYPGKPAVVRDVIGAGTTMYSHLSAPLHNEVKGMDFEEYLYGLQKEIYPIIKQLHDEKMGQVSEHDRIMQMSSWWSNKN